MALARQNYSGRRLLERFKQVAARGAMPWALAGLVLGSGLLLKALHAQVEQRIANSLQQPIQLGGVRGVAQWGIVLGKTVVPRTQANGLAGEIDAVVVLLDWPELLHRGQLRMTVTLVRPDLSVVVPKAGTGPGFLGENGSGAGSTSAPLSGTLEGLWVEDGRFTLYTPSVGAAAPWSAVTVHEVQAAVRLPRGQAARQVAFALEGLLEEGHWQTSGTVDLGRRSLQARLQTQNLPLSSLNLALPPAVNIRAGVLNSDLRLTTPLPNAVVPPLAALDLRGTVAVRDGQGEMGQQSAPVQNLQSLLELGGQRVTLSDTYLNVGAMALTAAGSLDLKTGYDLSAQVPPIAAEDLRAVVGDRLPLAPQPWQWQARLTGSFQEPVVAVQPDPALTPPGQLPLGLGLVVAALGMQAQTLPPRDWIGPIEGATYEFRGSGAWFTLSDGTVVPPLSEAAYQRASGGLDSRLRPALDRKFFWFLQTNPYVTAIAADLAKGRLLEYRQGGRFNTDRFFLEYFVPVYVESSRAAGLDPGESLWMLDHSLRTLHDPLLRHPDARPITAGAGTAGSFWAGEQLLSMQQLLTRPLLAEPGQTGQLARLAVLKQLDASTSLESRRLSSTPELMSKIPNVTFGAEEGAIALALGIMRFEGEGLYPDSLRSLAAAIEQNEFDKHALRTTIMGRMRGLATEHRAAMGFALLRFSDRDWAQVGMGKHLFPGGAARLTGDNTLSVMVSRHEKAGYSLEQAYQNSRLLLLELLAGVDQGSGGDRIVFALLKDHAFSPRFWQILAQKEPLLGAELGAIAADISAYRQLAQQGATLHESFYAALVTTDQDIGVSATLKQAVGFQAHLARLLDQAFAPADPADPRYRSFRRSLAIYLREAPDISVYGGTEAALRAYGQETLNVQELVAVDVADAPRIRAMVRLYHEALASGLITEWDAAGFQRILLTGALLAAGVERPDLPPALQNVGFPSAQFRRDLLFVVGVEGIQVEATRLGIQAHDHRVSFQPVARPGYRVPALNGADAASCPSEPYVAAIALGAATAFVWDAEAQRVMLRRGSTRCPLPEGWTELFFPALLESVPIEHSEAGRDRLQDSLQTAKRLEAGIF
ncbi:MAG: AsmA-like C-terminal region-containing protein [Tildeniella torsiva UHER 1998/13D]|nr:AsmA-like C-terminal region-containing protein [Tildeniella torsiva UHER 1998/13D]